MSHYTQLLQKYVACKCTITDKLSHSLKYIKSIPTKAVMIHKVKDEGLNTCMQIVVQKQFVPYMYVKEYIFNVLNS